MWKLIWLALLVFNWPKIVFTTTRKVCYDLKKLLQYVLTFVESWADNLWTRSCSSSNSRRNRWSSEMSELGSCCWSFTLPGKRNYKIDFLLNYTLYCVLSYYFFLVKKVFRKCIQFALFLQSYNIYLYELSKYTIIYQVLNNSYFLYVSYVY